MAAISVMMAPTYNTFYDQQILATISEIPVIASTHINSYTDTNNSNADLTLGATKDVRIESVGNTNMYVMEGQYVNLFETTVVDGTRTDYNMLGIRNASNVTTVIKPSTTNRVAIAGGDTQNTVSVGGVKLNTSGSVQIVSTSSPFGFRMTSPLEVLGDITATENANIGGDVIASGDMYSQTYNLYKNLVGDSNLSQVAYAFYINEYNQLELLRYQLYSASNSSQERVMTWGTAIYNTNGEKQVPTSVVGDYTKLDVFNNIISDSNSNGGTGGGNSGNGGTSYLFLNNSGNLYINEGQYFGIGNADPIYELDVAGTIRATTMVLSPQYLVSSDQRLKENIKLITDLNSCLDTIKKLNVYNFNFKSDPNKITKTGFIAQEVKRLIPNAVKTTDFGGLKDCMQIDTDYIIAYLVSAVKALAYKISP